MFRQFYIFMLVAAIITACGKTGEKTTGENKKVFKYNMAEGISSLDPAFARNKANIWAIKQMYNGLLELNNDMYPVPEIAESWEISEDKKVYTFTLKKGVFFHDSEVFPDKKGREVKASDFVYSFKRIVDPGTASTGAWIFNDKVKKDKDGKIAEDWVEATGDYTLKITLDKPFGPFLEILTMPYAFVVPKEAVEKYGKDFRVHPVGTGAFVFKSWDESSSLIMLKNENYWKKDEKGAQLPYLDAVQVSFISDRNQELLTFEQGKLDFMSGLEANSMGLIMEKDGSLKKEFEGDFQKRVVPYLNTEYIGFQLDPAKYTDKNHPFLNKKFRQAMNYAINREEMISFLFFNVGDPGTAGFIPTAISAFADKKVKGYNYDPKKAAELLKEAGYPEGKGLPAIKLNTTQLSKTMVEYLQKQWAAVGIKVEIEMNPVATHQELVDNGRVNFFRGSWLGDYPDPENFLALFYSKNFSPAGPNKTHFQNTKFDELYEKARLETEGFKRIDIYTEMDKIIVEEAPVIVLFYDQVLRLTQNYVKGMEPNPMNILELERVDFVSDEPMANK